MQLRDIITLEMFKGAFPFADEIRSQFYDHLPYYMGVYDINTPQRIANFFANVSHECVDFTRLEENLNYSADALIKLFSRARISIWDANKYGRKPGQRANQDMIANTIYGGEWGKKNLGNTQPIDGSKFIGRGCIHLTGKANYKRFGTAIGEPELFLKHPELIKTPQYASWSACWFWKSNGLNEISDTGDLRKARRVVNGGALGLDAVLASYGNNIKTLTA